MQGLKVRKYVYTNTLPYLLNTFTRTHIYIYIFPSKYHVQRLLAEADEQLISNTSDLLFRFAVVCFCFSSLPLMHSQSVGFNPLSVFSEFYLALVEQQLPQSSPSRCNFRTAFTR